MTNLEKNILLGKAYSENQFIKGVEEGSISDLCLCIAVQHKPAYLKYIKNPTDEIIAAAITGHRDWGSENNVLPSLCALKNLSKQIKFRAAVCIGPEVLKYIKLDKNEDNDVLEYIVKEYDDALQYIKNPSEELKLLAVNNSASALKYIVNPSKEILNAAINYSSYDVIFCMKNNRTIEPALTLSMKKKLIKEYPDHIDCFHEQPLDLCLVALNEEPNSIRYMTNTEPELVMKALELCNESSIRSYLSRITKAGLVNKLDETVILALQLNGYKLFGLKKFDK